MKCVLRLLEHRDRLAPYSHLLNGLLRRMGLFPYLDEEDIKSAHDYIAYEFHRAPASLSSIVFHRDQGLIYRELKSGANVVLSAPTSFGKSLLIDAIIADGDHNNILVCVPTIALIDETRRRLSGRFGKTFRVLTHPSQARGDRNIFVLTQERALDLPSLEGFSLFVLDEFYKLQVGEQDETRSALLNELLYRMLRTDAQFYLLGPSIREISSGFEERYQCKFVQTNYATVACEVTSVTKPKGKYERLIELCKQLGEPTLIFCSSPDKTRKIAEALLEAEVAAGAGCPEASEWIGRHYHPEWIVARSLAKGIGIHHGAIPRALAQYIVRSFNDGLLRFLICTSTLIEGVNTSAKNVVVFDNTIVKSKYDFFTFNNIKGRSGRMYRHFVGQVFLFEPPPQAELPLVEIPFFSQTAETPESLLVQLESEDLNERSRSRLEYLEEGQKISLETIRQNRGISPERQIKVAEEILSDLDGYAPLLSWSGIPNKEQRECVATLIWDYLATQKGSGVRSAKQLAFKISRLASTSLRELIEGDITNRNATYRLRPTEACDANLSFVRNWMSFRYPRYLSALDRIQRELLRRNGFAPGNYEYYAARVENLFLGQAAVALDEYGLPPEISVKLGPLLDPDSTLDDAIRALRALDSKDLQLVPFERELLDDTIKHL